MDKIFGKDLSAVYNDKWGNYGVFAWPFIIKQVKRRCPLASTWLDLCCGNGAFLQVVARHGFAVTGVDQSSELICYAREKVAEAELQVTDIRKMNLEQKFDIITCMGDSLNYLTDEADLDRTFKIANRCLSEKGIFIFDIMSFEGLKRNWKGTEAIHDPHRTLILEQTFDEESALGRYLFTGFVKEGEHYRRYQEEHFQRGYRPEEVEKAFWRQNSYLQNMTGTPLGGPEN